MAVDFLVDEVRLEAAAARLLVLFFAERFAEAFAPPRADERALDFFAERAEDFEALEDRFAEDFFAADFFAPVFLVALLLALVFDPLFFAADFFAPVFLAAPFRAPDLELLLLELLFFVELDEEPIPFPPAPPAEF